jgi:hypothetical protein
MYKKYIHIEVYVYICVCVRLFEPLNCDILSLFQCPPNRLVQPQPLFDIYHCIYTHTHTHTRTYIYIYTYIHAFINKCSRIWYKHGNDISMYNFYGAKFLCSPCTPIYFNKTKYKQQ